jgi:predicted DNA-binding transcriptional regulator AlpA
MPTTASTITRSPVDAINGLSPGDRRVLNENELAQRWGLSPKTLQRWRSEGRGPRYLKLSKRVSYPWSRSSSSSVAPCTTRPPSAAR